MNEFDLEQLARLLIQKHNEGLSPDDARHLDFEAMTTSDRERWMESVGAVARQVANQIRK
jgi:hypothetical protein